MKRVFRFILIMVMAIAYTMTADAKDVFFATHRSIQNEYGEILPENPDAAYCPTRIELDLDAKTLVIKTKTRGTASYTFSDYNATEKAIFFYDAKGKEIGCMLFSDTRFIQFKMLVINKGDTLILYSKYDD